MSNKTKGILCVIVATVLFSTMEIALKVISGDFNPVQLTFVRFIVGALVLVPFGVRHLKKHGIPLKARDLWTFTWLGFLLVVLSLLIYQMSLLYAQASDVAILFCTNTVFITVFSVLILKERLPRTDVFSLVLAVLGIVLIINPLKGHMTVMGTTLILVSAALFGLYTVLCKRTIMQFGAVMTTAANFLLGGIELMLISAFGATSAGSALFEGIGLHFLANVPLVPVMPLEDVPMFLYVCIGVTGIGFLAYFMAIEALSPSFGALTFFFKPALAPFLCWLILGEHVPSLTVVGICLILAGSLFSLLPQLRTAAKRIEATPQAH